MKKILFFFSMVLFIFIISSCDKGESQTVKIMVPGGAPTLGFVKMKYDNEKILNYNIDYDLTSGPDLLRGAMTSKSHQIVVAPTNMGANLYSRNKTYIYAGTLTFGNLYLVSTEDISLNNLSGKSICAFGKESTPDIILRKVLGNQDVKISYSNSGIDVSLLVVAGTCSIALLAEPELSELKEKINITTVIDLQEEYEKISQNLAYPQAGIFINKEFANENKEFVEAFLEKLKESVDFLNNEKEKVSDYYQKLKLKPERTKAVLISSIPGSNVGFLSSSESKELIEQYFEIIMEFNPDLIGNKLPDDDFYLG